MDAFRQCPANRRNLAEQGYWICGSLEILETRHAPGGDVLVDRARDPLADSRQGDKPLDAFCLHQVGDVLRHIVERICGVKIGVGSKRIGLLLFKQCRNFTQLLRYFMVIRLHFAYHSNSRVYPE